MLSRPVPKSSERRGGLARIRTTGRAASIIDGGGATAPIILPLIRTAARQPGQARPVAAQRAAATAGSDHGPVASKRTGPERARPEQAGGPRQQRAKSEQGEPVQAGPVQAAQRNPARSDHWPRAARAEPEERARPDAGASSATSTGSIRPGQAGTSSAEFAEAGRKRAKPVRANQPQAPQGQNQAQRGRADGNVTLTSEQRTKIQQTVLAGNNVPRVNNVNFALNVGVSVPRSVRVVDVPSTLIEIYPQWRGHQYFVVNDDIVIVDRSRRIVTTLPMSSSAGGAAQVDRRAGGAQTDSAGDLVNLGPDEIPSGADRAEGEGLLPWRAGWRAGAGDNAGADRHRCGRFRMAVVAPQSEAGQSPFSTNRN